MSVPAIGISTILLRLAQYRWILFLLPTCAAVLFAIKALLSPVEFTAYARLLPPQANNTTASSLASQIGGNAMLGASALTLKNPSDLYASIFFSRYVQDYVITEFQLAKYYKEYDLDSLRSLVSKNTKVEVGRDGIITLSYTDESNQKAAQITNGMITAMYKLAKELARNEALRRSEFYDTLIDESIQKRNLVTEKLVNVEKKYGLTRLKGQEEASSAALIEIKGMIATKEIELQTISVTATPYHPEFVRIKAELEALKIQLQKLTTPKLPSTVNQSENTTDLSTQAEHHRLPATQNQDSKNVNNQFIIPFESYAEVRSIVESLRREEELTNQVVEQLIKAKALSRVDESRDLAVISVLDAATPPTKKSGPRVTLMTISAAIITFLLTMMGLLMWDVLLAGDARKSRWTQVFWAFFGSNIKKSDR